MDVSGRSFLAGKTICRTFSSFPSSSSSFFEGDRGHLSFFPDWSSHGKRQPRPFFPMMRRGFCLEALNFTFCFRILLMNPFTIPSTTSLPPPCPLIRWPPHDFSFFFQREFPFLLRALGVFPPTFSTSLTHGNAFFWGSSLLRFPFYLRANCFLAVDILFSASSEVRDGSLTFFPFLSLSKELTQDLPSPFIPFSKQGLPVLWIFPYVVDIMWLSGVVLCKVTVLEWVAFLRGCVWGSWVGGFLHGVCLCVVLVFFGVPSWGLLFVCLLSPHFKAWVTRMVFLRWGLVSGGSAVLST